MWFFYSYTVTWFLRRQKVSSRTKLHLCVNLICHRSSPWILGKHKHGRHLFLWNEVTFSLFYFGTDSLVPNGYFNEVKKELMTIYLSVTCWWIQFLCRFPLVTSLFLDSPNETNVLMCIVIRSSYLPAICQRELDSNTCSQHETHINRQFAYALLSYMLICSMQIIGSVRVFTPEFHKIDIRLWQGWTRRARWQEDPNKR